MKEASFRYVYGGDEFVFVELSDAMKFEATFQAMAICNKLQERELEGIIDICSANGSYTVQINPDILYPDQLIRELKELEKTTMDLSEIEIKSRLVDVPILFEDPWTHEALMRFRDRHQDPNSTDLEYTSRVNGFKTKEDFIHALTDAPYLITMLGFVPGLGTSFQLVPREQQIEAPKYLRPRTYTPERAFGFGGAFACIYPVQGAGGYQLFGIAPAPVFHKQQILPDFRDSMVFPRQGDIFRYRKITMEEFEQTRARVENGTFKYHIREITYTPDAVLKDLKGFSENVMRRLYHD